MQNPITPSSSQALGKIGITGASGYIGSVVVARALKAGFSVVAIGRRPARNTMEWRQADLMMSPPPDLLNGLDGVIHLAAETGGHHSDGAEIDFAKALAISAKALAIPFVFVSSQAAAPNAPSHYGRSKALIEQAIGPLGAVIVRPGLVVGGLPKGLQGQLRAFVVRAPLLPRLYPAPLVQPVHVEDLAEGLLRSLQERTLSGQVLAIAGKPIPFHEFLIGLAIHNCRRHRLPLLPVPVILVRSLLAVLEKALGPRFSSERLDSLMKLQPLDTKRSLDSLDLHLRPLEDALDRRGSPIRRWLREANTFARAILGYPPPVSALRRYVRLLRQRPDTAPLTLPSMLLDHPGMVASLDIPDSRGGHSTHTIGGRLNLMIRVLESEPALVDAFLSRPGKSGRLRFIESVLITSITEIAARLRRPIARWHLKRALGGTR